MDGILSLDSTDIKTGIKRKDILLNKPQVDQTTSPKIEVKAAPAGVMYKLRDINKELVQSWKEIFKGCDQVEVSYHWPNGDAIIIQTCQQFWGNTDKTSWEGFNQGTPIKYLISAPTMRVPMDVSDSINAYLAFRAVILAVQKHNANSSKTGLLPISSVLCPGLATNVGMMPPKKCAKQMKCAYEIYELKEDLYLQNPESLGSVWEHHLYMKSDDDYNPEITFLEES
nr:uncharacterized protein LOC129258656 [Lytechinus pictus]